VTPEVTPEVAPEVRLVQVMAGEMTRRLIMILHFADFWTAVVEEEGRR